MEVPYNRPSTPRLYHGSSRQPMSVVSYEDDDIMSSSSCNFPPSNGSLVNFEPPPPPPAPQAERGGCGSGSCSGGATPTSVRVRDIVKLFDSVAKSTTATNNVSTASSVPVSAATPVRRANSILLASSKPYYAGGICNGASNFSGSHTNVRQYVSQFQEADEQAKGPERCRRCNILKRCDEVHYCISNKQRYLGPDQSRFYRNESECNGNGAVKPCNNNNSNLNVNNNSNGYLGFIGNRNNVVLRSPSKDQNDGKNLCSLKADSRLHSSELYEDIDCIPVEAAYDSKTTIIKTSDGVRIVVDIMFNQNLQNLSAADVVGSRVETDIPRSRILSEFQQQTALTMGGSHNAAQEKSH